MSNPDHKSRKARIVLVVVLATAILTIATEGVEYILANFGRTMYFVIGSIVTLLGFIDVFFAKSSIERHKKFVQIESAKRNEENKSIYEEVLEQIEDEAFDMKNNLSTDEEQFANLKKTRIQGGFMLLVGIIFIIFGMFFWEGI